MNFNHSGKYSACSMEIVSSLKHFLTATGYLRYSLQKFPLPILPTFNSSNAPTLKELFYTLSMILGTNDNINTFSTVPSKFSQLITYLQYVSQMIRYLAICTFTFTSQESSDINDISSGEKIILQTTRGTLIMFAKNYDNP